MSKVVICIFLLFAEIDAVRIYNETYLELEAENLQEMQKFEESARRQWEQSSRMKSTTKEEELDYSPEELPSQSVELFTWFPWFENNSPTIHTIKAIATFKQENTSKFPAILGVGSWQEITLFGKKKEGNSLGEPDASALSRSSKNAPKLFILIVFLSCLLIV